MTSAGQVRYHFGIDAFPLTERPWANSVNHFLTQILLQLRPQDWDARFTCFTRRSHFEIPEKVKNTPAAWIQPFGKNFVWRHIALPLATKQAGIDAMWYPFNIIPFWTTTPSVVTVHDVSCATFPHLFNRRTRLYFGAMLRRVLAQASRIVTISRFTANELVRLYDVKASRITVIYHGFNERPILFDEAATNALITKYDLREPFFLFLGGDNPRKNPDLLLELLAHSSAGVLANSQFIITGSVSVITRLLAQYGLNERIGSQIILPGLLSENDLDILYRKARALLYLSHYEGFGFPILEAFARNCPVIALRSSSLPEIAGNAALFVETGSVSQLEGAMAEVSDDRVRSELIEAGRKQGLRFSWSEAAERLHLTLVQSANRG
jgi:glycosyltransferase involved in cell wall biosynthesis